MVNYSRVDEHDMTMTALCEDLIEKASSVPSAALALGKRDWMGIAKVKSGGALIPPPTLHEQASHLVDNILAKVTLHCLRTVFQRPHWKLPISLSWVVSLRS